MRRNAMMKILMATAAVLMFAGTAPAWAGDGGSSLVDAAGQPVALSDAQLDALRAGRLNGISSVSPGVTISPSSHYSLVWNGKTWTVVWN
jgi:hypothetical protein